jgi:hypothetical protein
MPLNHVGFESTIPVFERAKTFCALDRMDTVNGRAIKHERKVLFIGIEVRFRMEVCIHFRPISANKNLMKRVGFEVLTAVVVLSYFFWAVTPCNSVKVKRLENF